MALERMFPGLREGAIKEGALLLDWGRDMAWYHFGGWKVRSMSSVDMLCSSRPFLESQVRRRLFVRANVRRLDRHDVTGLCATVDHSRVTGVMVAPRDEGYTGEVSQGGTRLEADLVVDAAGRGSRGLSWLEVDPVVYRAFIRVMHMLEGPETLFDPRIVWRAVRAARSLPS